MRIPSWNLFSRLRLCRAEEAQSIGEYALMVAVILVVVIGAVRLIGGNVNDVFLTVARIFSAGSPHNDN